MFCYNVNIMSETQKPDLPNNVTPIEQAPSMVQADRDAVLTEVVGTPQSLIEATQPPVTPEAPVESAPAEQVTAKKEGLSLAQKLGAFVGISILAGTTVGLNKSNDELPEAFKNPSPNDIITVQEGDTLTGVAEKIAQNTPIKETMQEAKEDLVSRNNEMGNHHISETSGLSAGDNLYVPANGDLDPNAPGYQLNPGDTPK
jgi:hypothetical protein